MLFVLFVDASQDMKRHENVVQQKPLYQLNDVGTTSTNHLRVNASDVDAGEFCVDFPADDCHYLADCAENAMSCADHYDDNYQVLLNELEMWSRAHVMPPGAISSIGDS